MFLSITLLLASMVAYVQGAGQCCAPLQYEAFQGKMTSHMKNGKFSTKFVSVKRNVCVIGEQI